PELEWIIKQSDEPFYYAFKGKRLWFMEINPVKEATMAYDPYKPYRISVEEMPSEVVTEIAPRGSRWIVDNADAWQIEEGNEVHELPTLPEERERINSALLKYGLVKPEFGRKHGNLPEVKQ